MATLKWAPIIERAKTIAESYDTEVTLRQLHYRLVAAQLVPNTLYCYKRLSELTAVGRRNGTFPDLSDQTRRISVAAYDESPQEALRDVLVSYQRDGTQGQEHTVVLGVEKNGLRSQLWSWFADLGVPIVALGGYASQSYVKRISEYTATYERDAILIYAGDFDPSGEDILRDFVARTGCWSKVVKVALSDEQVRAWNLPESIGKDTDSRAGEFEARYGRLVQVELDAVDPPTLRGLYQDALDEFWDASVYEALREHEEAERDRLRAFIRTWTDEDA